MLMSNSIGKYLIEYLNADRWRLSWITSRGRGQVVLHNLEESVSHLVATAQAHRESFLKILLEALHDRLDHALLNLIPETYLCKPARNSQEKFQIYQEAILVAFNQFHQTKYILTDFEPYLSELKDAYEK